MSSIVASTPARARALGLTESDLQDVRRWAQDHQRYLNKLAAAREAGDHERADLLTSRVLNSPKCKAVALLRILQPTTPASTTLASIRDQIAELDPFKPIAEPVRRSLDLKLDGNFRQITKFGWRRRALQRLCADILLVRLPVHDFDYLEFGRGGIEAATARLIEGMESDDCQFVVLADIKDCYGSINKDRVADLIPLPRAVTENVLLLGEDTHIHMEDNTGGHDVYLPIHHHNNPNSYGRQGLPQGAPTSRVICSRACLGSLLGATSFSDRIVLYGDDIAILAKDEAEARGILECLRSCLKSCPVGPLVLGRERIQSKYEPVYFTKYGLRKLRSEPGVRVTPSYKSFERLKLRSGQIALACHPEAVWETLQAYLERWLKAFPLCQPDEYLRLAAECAQANGWTDALDWAKANGPSKLVAIVQHNSLVGNLEHG